MTEKQRDWLDGTLGKGFYANSVRAALALIDRQARALRLAEEVMTPLASTSGDGGAFAHALAAIREVRE